MMYIQVLYKDCNKVVGMARVPLGLRMDADIKAMADTVAKMERRTLTNLIEVALEQYCQRALKQSLKDEPK
jgi:predicted transcriptional regulator